MNHSGPWTIEDVEALPDYGHHSRFELLTAGVLTISPAPGTAHQRASLNLANALIKTVPPHLVYAEAEIPVYWRLELEKTPHLVVSELRRGRYVQVVVATAGELTVIDRPFRVAVDPAALVRRAGS